MLVLVIVIGLGPPVLSQTIVLKTGQRVETLGLRRDQDTILGKVQIGSSSGEVGYNIPQIAKIEFPEPRGLKNASDLLTQGQPEKALTEIAAVVEFYEPFKEIPGAWWAQAAVIKVSALSALKREPEAEALAAEIQKAVTDPETARSIQLRLISGLIRKRDFDRAIAICDAAIKESNNPATVGNAWLSKGEVLAAQKHWDAALLAYLHVPVFFSDERSLLPAALLGSARAYRRLDDNERAKKSFNELISTFPKSAEAAVAQSELQKMTKQ